MTSATASQASRPVRAERDWRELVRPYTEANDAFAWWQLASTLTLYFGGLALMFWSLQFSYVYTLLLSLFVGGLAMRVFVLFHDCCHLSFFRKRETNELVGALLGPIVFTCYMHWRLEHNVHHATSGNVERRGLGDVPTLTRKEWEALPPLKRWGYRVLRNPFVLFTVAAVGLFLFAQRTWGPKAGVREKRAVMLTNVQVVLLWGTFAYLAGFANFALVMAPTVLVGAFAGVWLFYVQHQYPDTYWRTTANWDYLDASLKGSSFYDLPHVLRYLSGNIGYHHIHHLSPRVPNYKLRKCHEAVPEFQVKPMGLRESFQCVFVNLIDDETLRVTSFRDRRPLKAAEVTPPAVAVAEVAPTPKIVDTVETPEASAALPALSSGRAPTMQTALAP